MGCTGTRDVGANPGRANCDWSSWAENFSGFESSDLNSTVGWHVVRGDNFAKLPKRSFQHHIPFNSTQRGENLPYRPLQGKGFHMWPVRIGRQSALPSLQALTAAPVVGYLQPQICQRKLLEDKSGDHLSRSRAELDQ
jgi:hypothetical protein